MNCHSFKKDMTILGTACFADYFTAFCDLLYGLLCGLTVSFWNLFLAINKHDQNNHEKRRR